jgi:Tol biopolymer transport system component
VHDRQSGTTERVSVDSAGVQAAFGDSTSPSISADGRYVAFASHASNLVSLDTNGSSDVFVHDRQSGTTERVSVGPAGAQANDGTFGPVSISADGRYVAFASVATNLVSGDWNDTEDVFVHDRQSGTTECVSVSTGGVQGNSPTYSALISADGRHVAFASYASNLVGGDTNETPDVFVRDRESATTERVSVDSAGGEAQANSLCFLLSITPDGRYVVFSSNASNLVSGDTNGRLDVFVRDRESGTTERVSVGAGGAQGNDQSQFASISADGRSVVFTSAADNLVSGDTNSDMDVFVRERCALSTSASFSGDGVNADVIAPVNAVLGSSWSAPLTIGHPHGAGGPLSLKVRSVAINGPTLVSSIGGRPTELLIAGQLLAVLPGTHDGSTGDIAPQALPPDDASLVGLPWAAQYVVLGGGFGDHSQAVFGVIGCE